MGVPRVVVLQILACVLGGYFAHRKGRNVVFWALACFLFAPMVLIIALLPPVVTQQDLRKCPKCSAIMLKSNSQCPRCGESMPIDMVECGSCGRFVPDARSCSECGAPLDS